MTGLLYKEFIQNRVSMLQFGAMLVMGTSLPVMMAFSSEGAGFEGGPLVYMMLLACCFILFFGLDSFKFNFLRVDESRKWADWVLSSPKIANGYVYAKYVFIYAFNSAALIYCINLDYLLTSLTEEFYNTGMLDVLMFSTNLLLSALELPLMFRFSAKMGEKIGTGVFLTVVFVACVYALFGDISMFGTTDDFFDFLMRLREQMATGELPDWLYLILGIYPCACFGLYIGSYHLSCKLFRKGALHYEK